MADNTLFKAFGFEIKRNKKDVKPDLKSVVPPTDPDGAGYVTSSAGYFGQYVNLDGDNAKDQHQLIMRYRGVSTNAEVDMAIDEIVNESITSSELEMNVQLNLDEIEATTKIKKTMTDEFKNILSMLNFSDLGHDIFRSWYVDGRIFYHLLIDEKNPKQGIKEIRNIDASKIRKVKNIKNKKDPKTGVKIIDTVEEFYIYEEKPGAQNQAGAVKFSTDSITCVTSGLLDETKKKVVSHLHKALKPINQLRMLEDSLVIYRLARAPERRIFYIDVGNLPRGKSEQYMKDIMAKYRNKLVYDANTGELKDDRKHMSMLEDFWLPRREGGRGTEISTLPGGDNLGQIDDILYFQKRLYRSLNVPAQTLEQENNFSLGRSNEMTRDEITFQKFIVMLRQKFSHVFLNILKKQLMLKGVITEQDWDNWKTDFNIDFVRDNHYVELKESEIMRERLGLMSEATQFAGEYISKEWIWKNVLRLDEDEIDAIQKQMDKEDNEGAIDTEEIPSNEPPAAPETPVSPQSSPININVNGGEVDKKKPEKKEHYIPTHEDELTEELTRYMAKINEQN